MRRLTARIFALACVLGMAGCQKTLSPGDVYAFPEPTAEIRVSICSQGAERRLVMGSGEPSPDRQPAMDVIEWFEALELRECEEPEPAEGSESCVFTVNGQPAFTYEDRGSAAFIAADDRWYAVEHPSAPPVEAAESQVRFRDRWIDAQNLSEETLEWLIWYNGLSEEEQLAVSAVPADLQHEGEEAGTKDAEAAD